MCGIAGFVGKGDSRVLTEMIRMLAYRGPDDSGVWQQNGVGLAHARLAIIDTSARGHQPMHNAAGTVSIVFNGEIYNYRQLREELCREGVSFVSHTDTEVIIQLYERHGEHTFERLHGMFAFALYDSMTRRLYLARDRAGEKPLYWAVQGSTLIFASEPKAVLRHPLVTRVLSPEGLRSYLTYDAALTPGSFWQGINKLPPATYLVYEEGRVATRCYWEPPRKILPLSLAEAKKTLDSVLAEAVSAQLVADVRLGVFLSGGLDSSLVAYYATRARKEPIHTFSLGFAERSYDESRQARSVAQHLGTVHHERIVSAQEVRDALPSVIQRLDEPIADPAILPNYLLSEFAREHVTVALGGEGGDELFLGYPTFTAQKLLSWYQRIPHALREGIIEPAIQRLPVSHRYFSLDFKAKQFIRGARVPERYAHQAWLESFNPAEQQRMLAPKYRVPRLEPYAPIDSYARDLPDADQYTQAMYLYLRTYLLDVVLAKVDRASMYHSLEVRAPFLHRSVLEFAFQIPPSYKHRGRTGKYLLRKLMEGRLPHDIVWRGKHGFGLPVGSWLRREWRELLVDTLSEDRVCAAGLCQTQVVCELIQQHLRGTHNHRKKLWSLLLLHLWYFQWVA
jgi:asparagine synthase (glutamine-hydrolysing)